MKKIVIQNILFFLLSSSALAQSLIPATSEDLNEFDRQVSEAQQAQIQKKKAFGAAVASEAKQLQNNADANQNRKNGKNSLDPRDRADQDRLGASNNGNNSGKDGKVDSPSNNNGQGNSKGHGKKEK